MSDRKNPKDVGRDAPGSRTAKKQRLAGTSSGPQKARDAPQTTPSQPPQTSQRTRRDKPHEHEPTVRKGYEAAQNPESQGDGDPGPEQPE